MADLQGPKIRVGKFKDGRITLKTGDALHPRRRLRARRRRRASGLDYKELPRDVKPGDVLLLDDGSIVLDVEQVAGTEVHSTRAPRRRALEQQGHQPARAAA